MCLSLTVKKKIVMRKAFFTIAIIGLIVGFAGGANSYVSRTGKAIFGVFFIFSFISRLLDGVDDNAKA